jgi:hypothetical protein
MLDKKPVIAVAAIPLSIMPQAHDYPAALELLSREGEFELPFTKGAFRIATILRSPETTVPEHHGAAAILALGDGALKVSVVEGMILDLYG